MVSRTGMTRRGLLQAGLAVAAGAGLAACGATPTPEVVEKVVEKVVTQVVEKEVTTIVEGTPQVVKETVIVEVAPTAAPSGPVEIRFAHAMGDDGQKVFENVVNTYMAANPDVKVSVEPTFDWDANKYLVQAASGSAPDVLWGDEHFVYSLCSKGVLLDMDPFIESGTIPLTDMAPINQYFVWQGKHYGLALWFGVYAMYYNKSAFDDAGIAYPTDKWTWEEDFLTAAKAVTKDVNGDGLPDKYAISGDYGWANPWGACVWDFGGEYYNADGTDFLLCKEPNYAGLAWYLSLIHTEHVAPDAETRAALAGGGNLFVLGSIAMNIASPWGLTAMRKITDFEWDVAPLPSGPAGQYSVVTTDSLSIYSQSKAPKETWKLIETLLSEEAGKAYCTEFKGPVPANLAAQQYFVLADQPPSNQKMLMEITDHVRVPMNSPYNYVVETPFYQVLDSVVQGTKTMDEAMAEVCPTITDALAAEIEKVAAYSA